MEFGMVAGIIIRPDSVTDQWGEANLDFGPGSKQWTPRELRFNYVGRLLPALLLLLHFWDSYLQWNACWLLQLINQVGVSYCWGSKDLHRDPLLATGALQLAHRARGCHLKKTKAGSCLRSIFFLILDWLGRGLLDGGMLWGYRSVGSLFDL